MTRVSFYRVLMSVHKSDICLSTVNSKSTGNNYWLVLLNLRLDFWMTLGYPILVYVLHSSLSWGHLMSITLVAISNDNNGNFG